MNVLIVGLGSIAKKHITALRAINPQVEIYALRSAVQANEAPGIKNVYHLDEVKPIIFDFAIISGPTAYHKSSIESLIALKIPLFIEKPVFDTLDNQEIVDKITQQKIISYVACNLRFLECLQFSKEFLKGKRINEVNIYCGSYLPDWRPGKNFREIYSANKEMGGGVHIDLIHELDYAVWLFNKPKTTFRFTSNASSLHISAVDYANYLLQYADFTVNITLNYFRRDAKRTLEVVCEDTTLYVDLLKNEVYSNNLLVFQSVKTIHDTYQDQLQFFIDNILTKKTSFNDINEAYEILKICLAND